MLAGRIRHRFASTAITVSAIFYVVITCWAWHISWRDPGSIFFDSSAGYDPIYSTVRLQQAEDYLTTAATLPFHRNATRKPETAHMCVGVASVARKGVRYLRTTVASLFEGLTSSERDEMELIVFLAETSPSVHPAFNETWVKNLADQLLLYTLSDAQLDRFKKLEQQENVVSEKMLFDYIYLMKACYETGAQYITLFEDDVLAMDGWYHRTKAGLEEVERKTAARKTIATSTAESSGNYLYLRLFYSEEYLGWNSEDMPYHIFWSLALVIAVALSLLGIRRYAPSSAAFLTNRTLAIVCCIHVPLLIILFFVTGRVTTMPLPAGVTEMNNYGCCAQGLTFPRSKAADLINWYDEAPRIGLRDSLIEQYADQNQESRWALTPSVIQHVGTHTSKDKDGTVPKRLLWSFPFELHDSRTLRIEHSLAT